MSVSDETGRYLAVSASDPTMRKLSYTSETDALGQLVAENPGITVDNVVSIPTNRDEQTR